MTAADPPDARTATDTCLDRATAARLRDESRRSRPRIAQRLVEAGHLPLRTPGADDGDRPDDVDEHRNLSVRLDENVAFFEHIDALHDRRLHSPSPRERQVATRALAEALNRIVRGYQVDSVPTHRSVLAARRADEWLGRLYRRLAARGPRRQGATRWWGRVGRWVRLALALVACLLLVCDQWVLGGVAVTARSLLSAVLYVPAPRISSRRRMLGYDPGWASCVCTHLGDAAVLLGVGAGLHLSGHPTWGAVTVAAAVFRLVATMLRVASAQHGFRLPRLWLDRTATAAVLPVAVLGAAALPPAGPGTVAGVPVVASAVVVVVAIGVVEVVRTLYFALCRRRLFRRAAVAEGGLVPDAIVAHTADGIVVNLQREEGRPPVFEPEAEVRHLRAVGADGARLRPARRGR